MDVKNCDLFTSNNSQKLDEDEKGHQNQVFSKKENLRMSLEEYIIDLDDDLDDDLDYERHKCCNRIVQHVRVERCCAKFLRNEIMMVTDIEDIDFLFEKYRGTRQHYVRFYNMASKHEKFREQCD